MIFELFLVMIALIVVLLLAGVGWRKAWPLLIAGLFLVLTGGVMISEGLRIETGSTYDSTTGVLVYDHDALLPTTDFTIAVFANSFFYGGFIVLIIAGALLVFKKIPGVEK